MTKLTYITVCHVSTSISFNESSTTTVLTFFLFLLRFHSTNTKPLYFRHVSKPFVLYSSLFFPSQVSNIFLVLSAILKEQYIRRKKLIMMKAGAYLQFPPGFRFHPTDEELVLMYLCRKCASQPIPAPIITELDLYRFNPWDLPEMALYGEKEWYFFSPRDRKYPNGSRPNRAAGTGYWKATGADKPIGRPKPVGIKKALVFYSGKPLRGEKTNWIMHEYRLADVDRSVRKKNSLRLDDWVLCRIYNKKGVIEKRQSEIENEVKPMTATCPPESVARLIAGGSSCSDQVVSPKLTYEGESERRWSNSHRLSNAIDFPLNYVDAIADNEIISRLLSGNQMWSTMDPLVVRQRTF